MRDGASRGELCLVTGATGFIGGHVARRLHEEGYRVRCLTRARSNTSRLEALGLELAMGDLRSADSLASATDGCRFVVHCGALVSDWATVAEIREINVTGTENALRASVAASVERFLHFSTTDVYGYPRAANVDETYLTTGFSNWYSQTKREAEASVRRAGQERGLDAVILRPATVYGPSSEGVVGEMARALCAGQMLMVGGGRADAGLTYVDNMVDAALLALRSEDARGHAFNLTDGLGITWRRFLDDLAEGLGCPGPRWSLPYGLAYGIGLSLEQGFRALRRMTGLRTRPLLSRQAVQVLGRDQAFSNEKAKAVLGWSPRIDYAAGLQATLSWLQDAGRSAPS